MLLQLVRSWVTTPGPGTSTMGITCPVCGAAKSRIVSSTLIVGAVKRTRRCTNGHLFPTMEKV